MRGSVRLQAVTEISTQDAGTHPGPWAQAPVLPRRARLNRFGPSARRWRALAKGFQARPPPSDSIEWRLRSRAGRPLGRARLGRGGAMWWQRLPTCCQACPGAPLSACSTWARLAAHTHHMVHRRSTVKMRRAHEGAALGRAWQQLMHLFHCTTSNVLATRRRPSNCTSLVGCTRVTTKPYCLNPK
jgi:hypothetical protein